MDGLLKVKECNQCGKCCINYSHGGLSASNNEIAYWETFRPDIYEYVSNGNIWMDPLTGKLLERCPWLQLLPNTNKYVCDIYQDRPDDCKHYPVTINQMIKDDCEMLEVKDITDLKKAQKSLDKLMAESRPSVDNI